MALPTATNGTKEVGKSARFFLTFGKFGIVLVLKSCFCNSFVCIQLIFDPAELISDSHLIIFIHGNGFKLSLSHVWCANRFFFL